MAKAGKLMEATADDLAGFSRHELFTYRASYDVVHEGHPQKAARAMVEHIESTQALIIRGFNQAQLLTAQSGVATLHGLLLPKSL